MKHPKFVVFEGKGGDYYFRLTARNGQAILASEGYSSKSGCKNGIKSVKKNATNDERYERKESKDGQYYFNLVAGNYQTIGKSEMYKSKQGRDNGIKSVMENAPKAPIEDTAD